MALTVFETGINKFWGNFFPIAFDFLVLFGFSLFSALFDPHILVSLEPFAPEIQPRWRGGVTFLRGAHQIPVWCSTAVESPVLRTVNPRDQILARGKAALPRAGCQKTNKGQASSSLPGWPQAPVRSSGSPLSFFPRGRTPVPPQSPSSFPLLEKNSKTHEILARPRLGPARGRVMAIRIASPSMKSPGIQTPAYSFGSRNTCGMLMTSSSTSTHAPLDDWACANVKKKENGGPNHCPMLCGQCTYRLRHRNDLAGMCSNWYTTSNIRIRECHFQLKSNSFWSKMVLPSYLTQF